MRKPYPDDLSDQEWNQTEPILEKVKKIKGRHNPSLSFKFVCSKV
jgi:hypothetical protein